MKKVWVWVGFPLGIGVMLLLLVFMGGEAPATASGVKIKDIKVGDGPTVKSGDTVVVHYIGKLKDGKMFDTSLQRKEPFVFTVGKGEVIKGWEQGVIGMKVGGVRELIIPADLAYGKKGRPPTIPPNSELHFDIQLLAIE